MSIAVPPIGVPSRRLEVSWEEYARLRADEQLSGIRMTYDRGTLDLMSPSQFHERIAVLLARMIYVWAEHYDLALEGGGNTTLRRADLARGLEPDQCFYLASEAEARAHDDRDLQSATLPDLVVEVDITTESRHRLPIYAALGINEVWQWRNETLTVLVLKSDGQYEIQTESFALPRFPLDAARHVLANRQTVTTRDLLKQFRGALK